MPGPEETDDADRTYDKSDKESSSSHGSSPSEEEKGTHSPDSPARSCSRSRLSRSPSPRASRSRSRSRSVSHPKRERQRSHSSDRHSRRRKPLRRSPDHRSRERGSRDPDRRRSYSRERRSHRGSRRSRSRSRSWDRKSRRSRSRERWREGGSRRSAHHYRRGHTRRGSRSRSRSRRCSRDRSRSRSRGGSHRRMLRDKPEKGMPMKQTLDEVAERKSSSAALMAATAAAAALNVDTSQDEKGSMGLPLNTSKPGGPMTPQMAVQQAMALMNAKAQQMTGIPLPTYYNPAAVNPLKYAEQVQKRKLLWQNKEKTETNHNTTSSVWENLTFSQDQDGKMTAKFRKLMGIKSETPADTQKPQDSFKKQEELFRDLDHQYEVARMSTHTHRGVGLGYSSQPTAIFPPSK